MVDEQITKQVERIISKIKEKHNSDEIQELLSQYFKYTKYMFFSLPTTESIVDVERYRPQYTFSLFMFKDDLTLYYSRRLSLYNDHSESMITYLTGRIPNTKGNLLRIELIYNFIMNDLKGDIENNIKFEIQQQEWKKKNSQNILERLSKY